MTSDNFALIGATGHIVPLATMEAIKKALNHFRDTHCDMVVAIGGGKVMDIGKTVSALSSEPHKPEAIP
ncbi:MAG: iron-containing alcohol dehydrogenase [Verrucomicrobia bacterium]|nr:iron-containing alcohol dehydrogenase [Verrucomicrobiota bacterium]MBT7064669.1 iron-containing alcohol dehydrogenase [Verrucomicrobiota bacterium]MBT7700346.1 iron-containing alcohol dehydrogenase [Verrucomicrobiota bacterium]